MHCGERLEAGGEAMKAAAQPDVGAGKECPLPASGPAEMDIKALLQVLELVFVAPGELDGMPAVEGQEILAIDM